MKKTISSFSFLFVLSAIYFLLPLLNKPVWAADNCDWVGAYPNEIYENSPFVQFAFYLTPDADRTAGTGQYVVKADDGKTFLGNNLDYISETILTPELDAGKNQYRIAGAVANPKWSRQYDTSYIPHRLTLYRLSDQPSYQPGVIPNGDNLTNTYCQKIITYKVVKPITPTPKLEKCELIPPAKNLTVTDIIEITAKVDPNPPKGILTSWNGKIAITDENSIVVKQSTNSISDTAATSYLYNLGTVSKAGLYSVEYVIQAIVPNDQVCKIGCPAFMTVNKGSCKILLNIAPPGGIGGFITLTPTPFVTAVPTQAFGEPTYTPTPAIVIPTLGPLCEQLANKTGSDEEKQRYGDCMKCLQPPGKDKTPGIWSAIGCLPTDYGKLISDYVFTTGVGIAGGIAFLYFLYGAFLILTSAGNPEKIEEAKQIITSALSGVLLIIFSIFLLKVIGVDILRIPGFK